MDRYDALRTLASAVADSPEPAFVVALDGTTASWNPAAAALFGISSVQALGRPCHGLVAAASEAGELVCRSACLVLQEASAGRSAPAMDLLVTTGRLGQRRCLRAYLITLRDPDGQPLGVLHLLEDVQERRALERVGERFQALTGGRGTGQRNGGRLLTRRERDVFRLLAEGQTARQIAAHLGIQHATARTHIQRILAKLGAHNRIAALSRALESGDPEAGSAT